MSSEDLSTCLPGTWITNGAGLGLSIYAEEENSGPHGCLAGTLPTSYFPSLACSLKHAVRQILDKLGELTWLFSRHSETCTEQVLWKSTHESPY